MNTLTISLSSSNTSTVETLTEIELADHTKIYLDLDSIYSKLIPIFLIIDWGDGKRETIDNDLYTTLERQDINIFNPNPILNTVYTHEFFPSSTALYVKYNIQVLIFYSNSQYSVFTIPLTLITNEYFESIGDLELINVNILPYSNNPKEYQLKTSTDNHLIELREQY